MSQLNLNILRPQSLVIILASTVALSSSISYATDGYQSELFANYEELAPIQADATLDDGYGLAWRYYLDEVDADNKPRALAAFLEKQSSVTFGFAEASVNIESANEIVFVTEAFDASALLLAFEYIVPDSEWILGANYLTLDAESDPSAIQAEATITGFVVGKYLADSSSLRLVFDQTETNIDINVPPFFSSTDKSEQSRYQLTYDTIETLTGTQLFGKYYHLNTAFAVLQQEQSDSEDATNIEWTLSTDYFFSYDTSLGLLITHNRGDLATTEGSTLGIRGQHFFNKHIALKAGYSSFSPREDALKEQGSGSLEIIARF